MQFKSITLSFFFLATSLLQGCAFHSTSKDWSGLVGPEGEPNYYKSTKKVALKLCIVIPFFGDVSLDGLVKDLTVDIAKEEGDKIKIVQASSENYWHGFPPFTWILTPCISTVAAQYQPSQTVYLDDQENIEKNKKSWKKYLPTNL